MIQGFPCLRQQTNWSCLPTAVFCLLKYLEHPADMDNVAEWCRIEPGGACRWDRSVDGLGDALRADLDVVEVQGDWDGVREAVEANDEPVIVQIGNPSPLVELVGFHAVVIVGVENPGSNEQVVYMDPSSGTLERKPLAEFLDWWAAPGEDAFLLR